MFNKRSVAVRFIPLNVSKMWNLTVFGQKRAVKCGLTAGFAVKCVKFNYFYSNDNLLFSYFLLPLLMIYYIYYIILYYIIFSYHN